MTRQYFSERLNLIEKSREAALAAIQIFNNPLGAFKSETYIVLFVIAWTYLLHAYYRKSGIEYRYKQSNGRFVRNLDGSIRYWDLSKCISDSGCPLDKNTINNLQFLIGLRNQVEHKKCSVLDTYLSARYQACALNFNYYLKKLHGEKFSLDENLALSLQFAQLSFDQANTLKNKERTIPKDVLNYISTFENGLTDKELRDERFSYRLLFMKVNAKRKGRADRVIEFLDPSSPSAKNINKKYWVKEDREKPKFLPTQIVNYAKNNGFSDFSLHKHTLLWKKHNAQDPSKNYGVLISGKQWYWYENWRDFVIKQLTKEKETASAKKIS